LDDIPLYGVNFDNKLSDNGTFTGTCRLDDERKPGRNILDATLPGRTLLVPELEGVPLSAFIIWARTYQAAGRTLQFYGETLESYPKQRINATSRTFTNVDKRNIFIALWNSIQADPRGNVHVTIPGNFATQIPTTKVYNSYEFDNMGKLLDDLASDEDSFDFRIQVGKSPAGTYKFTMLIGYPSLGLRPAESGNLVFGFPGAVTQFWVPENASAGVTSLIGIGKGDGPAQLSTRADNATLLNAGYPIIEDTYSIKDEGVKATLGSRTRAEMRRRTVPVSVPTIEVDPQKDPVFGSWSLGDYATFDLQDPRYPDGARTSQRIIQWSYTPSQSDTTPLLHLTLSGEEEAATAGG
jgi:hypothetical protein